MNIALLNNFKYFNVSNNNKKISNLNKTNSSLTLRAPLKKDIVSFGSRSCSSDIPNDIQLYRTIGEGEYLKLLQGETIGGTHYVTSDPRGWGAKNWHTGYANSNSEPVYFITFKTDADFFVDDRRDNETDTRYGVSSYSLDDIRNIRKGSNAHGEIVYAENIKEERAKDIKVKQKDIETCKKSILSTTASLDEKEEAWDILASYAQEFPDVVDFECDFDDETFINGLTQYIDKSNNPAYKDLAKQCIKAQINHPSMRIIPNAICLFEKYDIESGVEDILSLLDLDKADSYVAADVLNNIIEDDNEDEYLIEKLKGSNYGKLLTLVEFLAKRNKDFKYNDVYRDILDNVITEEMYLNKRDPNA